MTAVLFYFSWRSSF